jgi:inner membrane protein
MDDLTHCLLGAVTAQLGFRSRIGRDATWVAAGAAIVIDADVFVGRAVAAFVPSNPEVAHLVGHRGLSHSLLMVPVVALAVAGGWWAVRRAWHRRRATRQSESAAPAAPAAAVPFGLLYACIFLATLTHPLLDWCTSYGTDLLAPLVDARFAADCIAIIDVIFTPLLALTLLACYVIRKRGWGERAATLVGRVGLALAIGYLCAGRAMHDRAIHLALGQTGDTGVIRADAYPAIGTIFLWRVVVETDSQWVVARVRPLAGHVGEWHEATKETGPWIERARELPAVRSYEWFAMGRVRASLVETAAEASSAGPVVEFDDMRYGELTDTVSSLWPIRVYFSPSGQVVEVTRQAAMPHGTWRYLASKYWRDITTP